MKWWGWGAILLTSMVSAQTAPTTNTDDTLINELAARGLDGLLERAFDVNHIPADQRDARRSLMRLEQLANSTAGLSGDARQQLVQQSAAGLQKILPALNDPAALMRQASILLAQGVEPDVNTLEYWGPNPRTQAQLRPIAQAVSDILTRCADVAKKQADEIANKITSPSSPFVDQYDQISKLAATAEYTKSMIAYDVALSLDPASPQRKKIAADAAEYLAQFNVPDNPDRGAVRNRLAKLAMTRGDQSAAKQLFQSTLDDSAVPGPTVPQQYEARYFTAVCDVLAGNVQAAADDLKKLEQWSLEHLPHDAAAQQGAAAAASLLQYRIDSLQAEQAKDPAVANEANQKAVAVLMELLQKRPELRPIIYEQLLPKLGSSPDLKTLDPLLLRALVAQGEREIQKPADQSADPAIIQRAVSAAHELLNRGLARGVDAQTLDAVQLLLGFFMQRLKDAPAAADAFLDYAEHYKQTNLKDATLALDNAQALIGQARAAAATRDAARVIKAYERFLPLAVGPPFDRKQFAFEYARRLQLNNKPADALTYYAMVPADDKRSADKGFFELIALKQELDNEPANSPARRAILNQIQSKVDALNKTAASAGNPQMLVRTTLLAADLARREQHDPARALKLLADFENRAKGLPDAASLINEALFVRVQSFMNQRQYQQATDQLLSLLNKTGGAQGAQIVYNLLQKLNEDFDRAVASGNQNESKALADNRAQLSKFLVEWAAQNKDADIRKYTYRYRVFDAETQRQAAALQTDPAKRAAEMKLALQRYTALQSDENVNLYKASLTAAEQNGPDLFDPQVLFGLADVQFEMGHYQQAADGFSKLIAARKLGPAIITTTEDGVEKNVDNDRYWEAVLKLIWCDQKLNVGLDNARDFLRGQYITWGEHVGGTKWKSDFEKLRQTFLSSPASTQSST